MFPVYKEMFLVELGGFNRYARFKDMIGNHIWILLLDPAFQII